MTDTEARLRMEPTAKRVRVWFGGRCIADSTKAWLVWENPHYPAYYIPEIDVDPNALRPTEDGNANLDVVVGDRVAPGAARRQEELVRFDWHAMDAWFEEDEEVFVHPRSPYTRVDVLDSSRHVQVIVNGETVAESTRPKILFETGLPPRYYLPKTDVRMDLLTPTASSSMCPYKGTARYWSVEAGGETVADLAWSYPSPFAESQKIAGLVCFYNERVDLVVDNVLIPHA